MKKTNLSRIMRKAWEIKKKDSSNIFSECLKMAWACEKVDRMVEGLNEMANKDYHINLGVDREAKAVKKDGKIFFRIDCFTLNGRYKGNYKAGYIQDGTYHIGRYDEINAETLEWIG